MVIKESAMRPNIGIIGIGMVGSQLFKYFSDVKGFTRGENLFVYDTDPEKKYSDDINKAEIIFISVPTPRADDGSCDLSSVEAAFGTIDGEKIVVLKSTVPPGTTEKLQKRFPRHKVLFNPEYLTESQAWEDMIKPDMQIVGFTGGNVDAARIVLGLLPAAPFMSPWGFGHKKYMLSATEAEFVKIFRNAFFSLKVTYANLLADACEKAGADYENVRMAMSGDHWIGASHLDVFHGGYRGFGGYCLPKDLDSLITYLKEIGIDADLMEAARDRNKKLLERQGLTVKEVSGHAHENKKKFNARS